MRRPFANPGQGAKAGDGVVERAARRKDMWIGESGGGKRGQTFRAGARQAQFAKICLNERVGRRENMGQDGIGAAQPFAELRRQPSGKARRIGDADLLAENGANGQFEPIPCAGHPQAGPRGDQRREKAIAGQIQRDRFRVGGEVENPPQPGDDIGQRRKSRKFNMDFEGIAFGGLHGDESVLPSRQMVRR